MQKGLRSLLRGTRSLQGRRRIAPPFWCAVVAGVLTVPAVALAQPRPDQPPPGLRNDAPTKLEPDAPAREESTAPANSPAPPQRAVETPQPQSVPPVPATVTTIEAQPVGRPFAQGKPQRRSPRVAESSVTRTISVSATSYGPSSRPYVLAALCLVVLVLGSGTLVTVLTRLGPTREGTA